MIGFELATEALGLSKEQMYLLIRHWYLSGLLDSTVLRPILTEKLKLGNSFVENMVEVLTKSGVMSLPCEKRKSVNLDNRAIYEQFLPEERHAAIALSLIEYLQQTYFTIGQNKEVSRAVSTEYTVTNQAEIMQLAEFWQMLQAIQLTESVKVTLVIGGMARTCYTYLKQLQEYQNQGIQLGTIYLFLSNRKLTTSGGDMPNYTEISVPEYNNYHEYLGMKYQNQALTEGLAMRDCYEQVFRKSLDVAIKNDEIVVIDKNKDEKEFSDANVFYSIALQQAKKNGHIKENDLIAVSSVQPYVKKYERQVAHECKRQGLNNISVHGFGQEGTQVPERLIQAIAMSIDTDYAVAREKIKEKTGIWALPVSRLQARTRDRDENQAEMIDATYLQLSSDIESVSEVKVPTYGL